MSLWGLGCSVPSYVAVAFVVLAASATFAVRKQPRSWPLEAGRVLKVQAPQCLLRKRTLVQEVWAGPRTAGEPFPGVHSPARLPGAPAPLVSVFPQQPRRPVTDRSASCPCVHALLWICPRWLSSEAGTGLGWEPQPALDMWWKDPPCEEHSWVSTVDALLEPLGSCGPTGWDVGCGASLCLHVVRVNSPAGEGAADRIPVSRKADQWFYFHFKESCPVCHVGARWLTSDTAFADHAWPTLPMCHIVGNCGDYLEQRNWDRKYAVASLGTGRRGPSCPVLGLILASSQMGAWEVVLLPEKGTQPLSREPQPPRPWAEARTPCLAVSGGRTLGSNSAPHGAAG